LGDRELGTLQRAVAYQRDETAYRRMFLYFHPPALRYCISILQNEQLAEEAVSDVMMKLWLMRQHLASIKNIRIYIFSALKRKALDYRKQNSKYRMHVELEAESAIHYQSPEDAVIAAEAIGAITAAIDKLPPKCKEVFLLVRDLRCSYREAATIMDISVNTVNRHVQEAVKHLRTHLDK
jgi:RNA polymerase sigma factor, sigma-70 family